MLAKSTGSLPGGPYDSWSKSVMLLSDMELFVPAHPNVTASVAEQSPMRHDLVQGELLRLFLAIHPFTRGASASASVSATATATTAAALVSPVDTPGSQVSEFFRTLTATAVLVDESSGSNASSSSASASALASASHPSTPATSAPHAWPSLIPSDAASLQPIARLNDQTTATPSTVATSTAVTPTPTPTPSVAPSGAAAATATREERPYTLLPNGDVLVPVEMAVSVKKRYLDGASPLLLVVRITVSPTLLTSEEALDGLLSPGTTGEVVSGSETREVRLPVRVISPLRVLTKRLPLGASGVVTVSVENQHETLPVTVYGAALQFLEPHDMERLTTSSRSTRVAFDTTELPLTLQPHEAYEFFASVEATPGLSPDGILGSTAIDRYPTWAAVTWSIPCSRGTITTRHDVPPIHVPNFKEMYLSVSVPPRVTQRQPFDVVFSVTNPTPNSRELVLSVNPSDYQGALTCSKDEGITGTTAMEALASFNEGPIAKSTVSPLQCLRPSVDVGAIPPMGTVVVKVPMLALAKGCHSLNPIVVTDKKEPAVTFTVRERCFVLCTD